MLIENTTWKTIKTISINKKDYEEHISLCASIVHLSETVNFTIPWNPKYLDNINSIIWMSFCMSVFCIVGNLITDTKIQQVRDKSVFLINKGMLNDNTLLFTIICRSISRSGIKGWTVIFNIPITTSSQPLKPHNF